jgi:hypothetical protein
MSIKLVLVLVVHGIIEIGLISTCFKEFNQYKDDHQKLKDIQRTLMAGTFTLVISALEVLFTIVPS